MAPPVLGIPDPKDKYLLKVDASDTAIGEELIQHQHDEAAKDKRIRLIAAVSRILAEAEVKWSVHEREGLAIIWALEKLKTYLVNAKFKICTDHRNLLWLLRQTAEKGRLARWGTIMSQWAIVSKPLKEMVDLPRSLEYNKGPTMHGPDAFSRMFDADDGGSAAPRREDMILPVLNCRHCKSSPNNMMDGSLRNVNYICTSRVKHATDNADNASERWHHDENVDIELARSRPRQCA